MLVVTCRARSMIDCTRVSPTCPTVSLGMTRFNLASLFTPSIQKCALNLVQWPEVKRNPLGRAWQRHSASAVRPVTNARSLTPNPCLFSCSHRSLPALCRARQAAFQVKRQLHSPGDCRPSLLPRATRASLDAVFMGQTGSALNLRGFNESQTPRSLSRESSELYPWIALQ